jgi:ribonuclease E
MTTRMLIDARHPEETRVAVVKGNRIDEFDFEAATRKQIKGNIYLAKVTRVEPSLQAAFIDYGGNRHGFLAFSEIHPDYYQIPREDREALLREEQGLGDEAGLGDDGGDERDDAPAADGNGEPGGAGNGEAGTEGTREDHGGTDDAAAEALRRRRMQLRRRYKIQDVIRRRQVMLVQVVKEERGNKGAALTTYISLAGRYGVLMPNTAQGGGISRKIANAADRKRLKSVISDLALPPTMGAIIRTAGLSRTRTEIRRDFDYLTRLWDEIREKTLASTAPALIYEDNDLLKRAIRDIYTREIDEVLVDGEAGFRQARAYMKLLMPSHARKVQAYSDPVPLFLRAGVEGQLAAMMNPVVQLKSGGYMVISPTEALVAVDVNSGRATRELNIEETALRTNIEAAEEVARQLRLRDMAGLIVVDFIDMEVSANNRKVEKALKDALKADRARVQVGRISPFGLLEMSRQRLRTGVLEASTEPCPHCGGSGFVRTESSATLAALRLVEEEAVKGRASQFRLRADTAVAIYVLNRKRSELAELETRYGIAIEVLPDPELTGARIAIDSSGPPPAHAPRSDRLPAPAAFVEDEPEESWDAEAETEVEADARDEDASEARDGERPAGDAERRGKRKRRRRGGRGRRRADGETGGAETAGVDETGAAEGEDADADAPGDAADAPDAAAAADDASPPARSRRRRGGRAGARDEAQGVEADAPEAPIEADADAEPVADAAPAPAARPRARRGRKAATGDATAPETMSDSAVAVAMAAEAPAEASVESEQPTEAPAGAPRGRRGRGRAARPVAEVDVAPEAPGDAPVAPAGASVAETDEAQVAATGPARKGWWQRTFGG